MSKTSSTQAAEKRAHVRTLADGTTKTYFYDKKPKAAKEDHYAPDTVGALVISYKRSPDWAKLRPATHLRYALYLKEVERLGHMRVAGLSRRLLLDMRDALAVARGHGAANGFLCVASRLLSFAVDRGWLDHNPARGAKGIRGGHLPAWTWAQAERALLRLPEHLRRVVVLALHTGQRRAASGSGAPEKSFAARMIPLAKTAVLAHDSRIETHRSGVRAMLDLLKAFLSRRRHRAYKRADRSAYAAMTWAQLHYWLNRHRWEIVAPVVVYPDWIEANALRAGMVRAELRRRASRRVPL